MKTVFEYVIIPLLVLSFLVPWQTLIRWAKGDVKKSKRYVN